MLRVWHRLDRSAAASRAEQLLAETGLQGAVIDRTRRKLSGGQCQRVGIARALACDPDVLVADEPTSSLDVSVQAQILNLLIGLRESRGLALVLISHDLGVVRYVCDYVAVMYKGRIVERGPVEQIFTSPTEEYTRALISAIPGTATARGAQRRRARSAGRAGQPLGRGSAAITRSSVRGPWTPFTRTISMSTVADGPEMNVSGLSVELASASGTEGTICSVRTTHRW